MRLFGQLEGVSVNYRPGAIGSRPVKTEFEEAFNQNYELIFRYLRRRVDEDLAADLTAETFSTALGVFDRFDPDRGNVRAWLFGIATNQLRRETRREIRELRAYARSGVDPIAADPMSDADERADAQQLRRGLARGLASLNNEDRDALLLFCWGELSYPEIAVAQAVELGTVKSRIARARRQLRTSLGEQEIGYGPKPVEEAANG